MLRVSRQHCITILHSPLPFPSLSSASLSFSQALQEFSSLCQKESQDSVTSILTLWTLMYNKLSMVGFTSGGGGDGRGEKLFHIDRSQSALYVP